MLAAVTVVVVGGGLKEGDEEDGGDGGIFSPFSCSGHMASSLFTCWASGSLRQGTHRKGTECEDETRETKRERGRERFGDNSKIENLADH